MVEAFELAVVLVQVVVASREAAGGKSERNLAEGEDLRFDAGWTAGVQGFNHRSRAFERRYPALEAEAGERSQRRFVVDVEMRARDEIMAAHEVDRTEIVGFKHAARVIDQAAQRLEIAFRFKQSLGGDDDLFAGIGQVARQANPVGCAQLLAARADDFADVDDVEGRVFRHFGVELHNLGLGPEIEQGTER